MFTFTFEELDAELVEGTWLPACLNGTADIEIHEDGQWSVEACRLEVCGNKGGQFMRLYSARKERAGYRPGSAICDMIERAISRNDAHHSALLEEITEFVWDCKDYRKEYA